MIDPPRRFRMTIGKTLLILFLLVVLMGRWIGPLRESQNKLVYRLLNPLFSVSNAIWQPIEDVFHHYFFLRGLQDENQKIKKENAELKQQWIEAQNQVQAIHQFQNLQNLWQTSPFQMKFAEVLTYDPVDPSLGIWINQGSENSIQAGQVVVASEGVVGVISKVYPQTAKIIPIISPRSVVDVEISPSGVRGILQGQQKALALDRHYWMTRLEYMGGEEKIEVGNAVNSSGLDKVFPRGLSVGKIQNLKKDEKGLFISAEVLPDVDFAKLREVAVLIP